jgi:hypothetical protein
VFEDGGDDGVVLTHWKRCGNTQLTQFQTSPGATNTDSCCVTSLVGTKSGM